MESYLRAYGPATIEHVRHWQNVGDGKARSWLSSLRDRVTEIDVGGARMHLLREDLEDLATTPPSTKVCLLPGYDQWILGPGTADTHIVPPARRALLSRQAPFVIVGGVVSGTWNLRRASVAVSWFAEAGPLPIAALGEAVERLAGIVGRPLQVST